MFLMRCIERRFEVCLPRKKLGRSDWLAAPQHLRIVYSDPHVSKAYRTLAQGRAIKFLSESDFRACVGDKAARWKELSQRERTALFNQTVRGVKEEVLSDLATREYCNHPHEEVLLQEIKQRGLKTLISVPTRDYAFFLGARLQHLFAETSLRVVVITGAAQGTRRGTNATQRQENLAAFNNGDARIAVATQVIDEGVDLRKVEQGYIIGFDGSQRRARQRQGRVGRHSFGRVTYLCASQRDYIKLYQIIKKEISFEEMVNNERARILQKAGFVSLTSPRQQSVETKVPGPPRVNPDDPPPF
jgi:ERCC4-related helicase